MFPGFYGSLADKVSIKEQIYLEDFIKNKKNTGRYKSLPALGMPGATGSKNVSIAGRQFNQRHYAALSNYLMSQERFSPYGYALLGALSCNEDDVTDFLPSSIEKGFELKYDEVLKQVNEKQKLDFLASVQQRERYSKEKVPQAFIDKYMPKSDNAVAALLYIVRNIEGPEKKDQLWQDLETISLHGDDSFGGVKNMAESLYKHVLDKESAIAPNF